MKFVHRLGYYLGGFAIGLIFLAFFLSGKRTSCDYGPKARVLKNISTKKQEISKKALNHMETNNLDSVYINDILRTGDVNFKRSNTENKVCNTYVIEDEIDNSLISLFVKNCDSIATITNIEIQK